MNQNGGNMFGRFFKKKSHDEAQQPFLTERERKDDKPVNESGYISNIIKLIKQPRSQHVFKQEVAALRSIYRKISWANEHGAITRYRDPCFVVTFISTNTILPLVFWGLSKAYEAEYKNVSAAYQAFKNDEICGSYSVDDYCPQVSGAPPAWFSLIQPLGQSDDPPDYDYCHGILEAYCGRADVFIMFIICIFGILGLTLEIWSVINTYRNITTYLNENEVLLLKKYGIAIQEGSAIADFKYDLKQVLNIVEGLKKSNIFKGIDDINNLVIQYCHSADSEGEVESKAQPVTTEEQNILDFGSITLSSQPSSLVQSSLPSVSKLLSDADRLSRKLSTLCGQKIRLGFANAKGDRIIIMGNESKLLDQDAITKIKNLVAVQGVTVIENKPSFWQNRNQKLEMNVANSVELSSCPIELLNEAVKSRLSGLASP